jgi:hypothetical protein
MTPSIRRILAASMLLFPCLFMLVFALHFRGWSDLLSFRLSYVPADPKQVVAALIRSHNRRPMIHDPHVLAYLGLPVLILCALGIHAGGRKVRPTASSAALMITLTGIVYMGGVFGMWTAFYRGLGLVDEKYADGATAAFVALTTPTGAFLLTTTLAKLTMVGFASQGLALLGMESVPWWAPLSIAVGAALFLAFWDLNNWMLIGSVFILAGLMPIRRRLLSGNEREA